MESQIKKSLDLVRSKIDVVCTKRPEELNYCQPRLVAVSKTKPKELIIEAYENGQRHFGENYIQELYDKSHDQEVIEKCPDIKWHMIGHVQGNKVNKLLSVRNLFVIETVDSEKLAETIYKAINNNTSFGNEKLKVMVQVNTSGEQNKSGIQPNAVAQMVKYINECCSNLQFIGLMTIGQFDHDLNTGPNPDFQCLIKCRQELCEKLGMEFKQVELSMGMSNDFEYAIAVGSTNVRVGTSIFGQRNYNK